MDLSHPSPHSRKTLPLRPLKPSQNCQRNTEGSIQMPAKPASVKHTNALNPINDPKSQDVYSTATLDYIKVRRNWEEDLSGKQIATVESTPLQRWFNESSQNESWNAVAMLKPVYEFTEGPEVAAEDNVDSISSCGATHTPSVEWRHVEVLSEENGPVLKSSSEKELELKGIGAGILGSNRA
jgi:hypothetical protein